MEIIMLLKRLQIIMNVVQVVPMIIHIIQVQKIQIKIIMLVQKVFLVLILNIFIMEVAWVHVVEFLVQKLKEEFVLVIVIQQRDILIIKQLMELLNAENIVKMMNIVLEKYAMIIVLLLTNTLEKIKCVMQIVVLVGQELNFICF